MGIRINSASGRSHIYRPTEGVHPRFRRVRIDTDLKNRGNDKQLIERLFNDDELLDDLAGLAAGRGLDNVNILAAELCQIRFVQQTCQSMIVPIAVLEYVISEQLPMDKTLGIPDFVERNHDVESIGGMAKGFVIALKGAFISPQARFLTHPSLPIILRENSTLAGQIVLEAGTVVPPGARLGENPPISMLE